MSRGEKLGNAGRTLARWTFELVIVDGRCWADYLDGGIGGLRASEEGHVGIQDCINTITEDLLLAQRSDSERKTSITDSTATQLPNAANAPYGSLWGLSWISSLWGFRYRRQIVHTVL